MSSKVDELLSNIERCMEELKKHVDGVLEAFNEVMDEAEEAKYEASESINRAESSKRVIRAALVDLFDACYGSDYTACRNDPRLTISQSNELIRVVLALREEE